jgi:WD40 repeat protein
MSPEQASGQSVGPLSDVYSLGAMLYCELTGRPPFKANSSQQTLSMVQQEDPIPPRMLNPSAPRDVETICLKCLEKRPEKRYLSAGLLADDLERFLLGEPIRARPRSWVGTLGRVRRRHPRAFAITAFAALTIIGAVTSLWSIDHMRGQRDLAGVRQLQAETRAKAELARRIAMEDIAATNRYHMLVGSTWDEIRNRGFDWKTRSMSLIKEAAQIQVSAKSNTELRTLAAASLGGVDLTNKRVIADDLEMHCLTYSPDGKQVAVGQNLADDQIVVRVYDHASGELIREIKIAIPPHVGQSGIRSVKYSPNGDLLVAATRHGFVYVWNTQTFAEVAWQAHDDRVTEVGFSPDGEVLATISNDNTVKIWRCDDWSQISGWDSPPGRLAFCPQGDRLAVSTSVGLTLVDATSIGKSPYSVLERIPGWSGHVAFSPDGEFIAWNISERIFIRSTNRNRTEFIHELRDPSLVDRSHDDEISKICFNSDGTLLVSGAWDHCLKLWDVISGELIGTHQVYGTGNVYPEFSPERGQLATILDGDVVLFSINETLVKQDVARHPFLVQSFEYSHEGTKLGSVAADVRHLEEGGETVI